MNVTRVPLERDYDLQTMQERLSDRFSALRTRLRLQMSVEAAARLLGTMVALAALSLLFDWWLHLSMTARLLFASACAWVVGYVAWRHLISPYLQKLEPIELASLLDAAHHGDGQPAIAPRVATVMQLPDMLNEEPQPSPLMIDRAVRRSFASLDRVDFMKRLSRRHLFASLAALLMAMLVPLLIATAVPWAARLWAQRWLLGSNQPWPRYTTIEVVGLKQGRLVVPRGEPFGLRVTVRDDKVPTEAIRMRIKRHNGQSETVTLTRFREGDFRYELPPLQNPATAELWGGDARIGPITFDPLDRPRVVELQISYRHPRDQEEQTHDYAGEEGNLQLLRNTNVQMRLRANVPVADVRIGDDSSGPQLFERIDDRTFVAKWEHQEALRMKIELASAEANLLSIPQIVSIGLKPDRPPRVSVQHRGVRRRITAAATIPLKVTARDDFGIQLIDLHTTSTQAVASLNEPLPPSATTNMAACGTKGGSPRLKRTCPTRSRPPAAPSIGSASITATPISSSWTRSGSTSTSPTTASGIFPRTTHNWCGSNRT